MAVLIFVDAVVAAALAVAAVVDVDVAPTVVVVVTRVLELVDELVQRAVEPLPPRQVQVVEKAVEAVAVVPCGICGQPVEPNVRADCGHGCGQVFHAGCQRAKMSVYRGEKNKCAVCGKRVA